MEEVQEIDSPDGVAPDSSLEPSPEPPTSAESEAAADDPSAPTGPTEVPSPQPADGVETDDAAVVAEVAGVADVTEVDGGVPHLRDEVGGEMPQASEGNVADGSDVDETPDDVCPDEDGVEGGGDGDKPDESSSIEEDPDA
jgi:hypothetical protein